jgi:alpha,alpha-trehalose-phosphate synthase [UDP-forming]
MHLSYRLSLALIAGVAITSLGFTGYQAAEETRGLKANVQRQALVLAESLEKDAEPIVANPFNWELQRFVNGFPGHESLAGIAVYDVAGKPLAVSSSLTGQLRDTPRPVPEAIAAGAGRDEFRRIGNSAVHILAVPLRANGSTVGALAVFHNVSYIDAQIGAIWRRALIHVGVETFFIAAVTLLMIHITLNQPLKRMAQWLRDLHTGRATAPPAFPNEQGFGPLTSEVARLASSLNAARAAAEEEARLRDAAESLWTLERLRIHVQSKLQSSRLFVISNREPYEHVYRGGSIDCTVPPSGLVTALEPVLQACGGTWIAQGTGSADRAVVDKQNCIAVPPDQPEYTLRRVWVTAEEQKGFYLGFANEGLWPLCHIAHTRPIFRSEDWEKYQNVNRKFAEAFFEEVDGAENPIVLVQDYHFALLPRMIKERRPDAQVAIFWHIPWPNSEAFHICPWQTELLDGLLGADLIGFQIQAHCNNFLDTVDQAVECRIEREQFAVNRLGHMAVVRPFPISVAFTPARSLFDAPTKNHSNSNRGAGIEANYIGVGVDRIDYTKGIPERFRAVERFLETYPAYRQQFTLIQIGAPSRTDIRRYQELMVEVESEADRINRRFQTGSWKPIHFIGHSLSHAQIKPYYCHANLCLVTALHDGMNLVAKEFVSSRDDESGVLILSPFTGASRELTDALIVNPYDIDALANSIRAALEMPREEQQRRMRRMRETVREHNIYRWAGNLIGELAELRRHASVSVADVPVTAGRL